MSTDGVLKKDQGKMSTKSKGNTLANLNPSTWSHVSSLGVHLNKIAVLRAVANRNKSKSDGELPELRRSSRLAEKLGQVMSRDSEKGYKETPRDRKLDEVWLKNEGVIETREICRHGGDTEEKKGMYLFPPADLPVSRGARRLRIDPTATTTTRHGSALCTPYVRK